MNANGYKATGLRIGLVNVSEFPLLNCWNDITLVPNVAPKSGKMAVLNFDRMSAFASFTCICQQSKSSRVGPAKGAIAYRTDRRVLRTLSAWREL